MATNLSSLHSGLFCIAVISRMNGAPLEMEQLQHQFGSQTVQLTPLELARNFKESGINATLIQKDIADLKKEFFPVVAMLDSGDYIVLARKNDEKRSLLVQESTGHNGCPWTKYNPALQTSLFS